MLIFFKNLDVIEFQVRYLTLFLLFLVVGGFESFWRGSLHKNIQLMLEFLKNLFLVLHFPYYTLMAFLIMLSEILLSMLIILLSTLNVIRHLICDNNYNWLVNLNLIFGTLWTGAGNGLLISLLKKLNWFRLTGAITGAIDMKIDGSFLTKNHVLRFWGWLSLLNWVGVSYTISIAKIASFFSFLSMH